MIVWSTYIFSFLSSYLPGTTLHTSRPGGRRSISSMFECDGRCGNSKLEQPRYKQHSNNRSSMMYSADIGFILPCYIHKLRKISGSNIPPSWLFDLCSNQLFDCFLAYFYRQIEHDEWCLRIKMMTFVCLNRVSNSRYGLWSSHSFLFSLQVLW
jgi:hypothetical protein